MKRRYVKVCKVPNLYFSTNKHEQRAYSVHCRINGKQVTRNIDIPGGASIRDMNNLVNEFIETLRAEAAGEIVRKPKPNLTYTDYIRIYTEQLADGTRKHTIPLLERFSLNERANDIAAKILLSKTYKPSTLALRCSTVNAFFRWLNERYALNITLPFDAIPKARATPRSRTATPDEIDNLLSLVRERNDDDLLLYTLLLINYGVRISTAYECTPATLRADGYHFYNVKKRRWYKYVIPCSSNETDELFRKKAQTGTLWTPGLTLPALNQRLTAIMRKAFPRDEKGETLSPHSLRHTFASRALQRGVDLTVISCLLDHRDISITLSTYAKFSPSQINEAMQAINQ